MRKLRTAAVTLASWAAHLLSHLVPRDERLWVFAGWHKNREREVFADNAKYLFLHVANQRPDIRAVWIARDQAMRTILAARGYESYVADSLRGIWYSLRAGYTVVDAVVQLRTWRYCGGSRIVQLWHADGLKTLRLNPSWTLVDLPRVLAFPNLYARIHFAIASSAYIAEHFTGPSFGLPLEQVRVTGLPRYDAFFADVPGADIDAHRALAEELDAARALEPREILFYAPTFRRQKPVEDQLAHLPLQDLNAFLASENRILFISLHPKFSATAGPREALSHIRFVNPEFDMYPFLPRFDRVITDYSSICLEFLLLDKPAIFYVYDFDEYKNDPGIPEKFWNAVPGVRVRTFEELKEAVRSRDGGGAERAEARERLFAFERGSAAKAVAEAIMSDFSPRASARRAPHTRER